MQQRHRFFCFLLIVCIGIASSIWAAKHTNFAYHPSASIDTVPLTTGKRLIVHYADRYNYQKRDSGNQFISLAGNVQVQQDKTWFYADSAVLDQKQNILEAFGNVHINDADSVHTYASYLKYLGKDKKAYLKKNVKLTDGKGVLTTSELEYDTNFKIGTYTKGGKVVTGKTVLTSKEGYYYGDTRDVYFKQNVVLKDPGYDIVTDTLQYNTYTNIATFLTLTNIKTESRKVKTKDGYYDLKNKKAYFGKYPEIEDSTGTLKSREMSFDDSTGKGDFKGEVVYRSKDSAGGVDIIANHLETNSKEGSFKATQAPLMIIKQGGDSIYVRADTFYSAKLSTLIKVAHVPQILDSTEAANMQKNTKDTASDKYFEAYAHVRIFQDSMQAIGDSLFYSLKDSVFRLFKNPVAWAQDNQITGDTIYLYTKYKKPARIRVFENAMAISKVGFKYYNQVGGKTINGFFQDGKIATLKCKGVPAESVYYGTDDYGNFFGVNKSSSDVIDVYFNDGKPDKVVFRNKLDGTAYPMGQVNHEEIKLRGFKWLEAKRPKSRFEILVN